VSLSHERYQEQTIEVDEKTGAQIEVKIFPRK